MRYWFELGFTTKLRLKSEAVPTLGLPRARKELPTLLPSHGDSGRHSEPKATREMACQTDPIISRHACVQANVKPSRRSKGLQVQAPHKSLPSERQFSELFKRYNGSPSTQSQKVHCS
uniref:Uncharacterized protein n=1 Tax=Knipowitschia caucasica TaxID=637954 RepID=A0AAV2M368_KNICA